MIDYGTQIRFVNVVDDIYTNPDLAKKVNMFLLMLSRETETRSILTTPAILANHRNFSDEHAKAIAYANKQVRGGILRITEMFDQYNGTLMKKGVVTDFEYGKTLDCIDARSIFEIYSAGENTSDEHKEVMGKVTEYIRRAGFMSLIPCYNNGLLRLGDNDYIIWEIININADDGYMKIHLTRYADISTSGYTNIVPIIEFDSDVHQTVHNNEPAQHFEFNEYKTVLDMYSSLPMKSLRWTKEERVAWSKVTLRILRALESDSDEGMSYRVVVETVTTFATIISAVNYMLSKRSARKTQFSHEVMQNNAYDEQAQKERVVRSIGDIMFSSVRPPRESTYENVVNYRVAAWNVRGHERHLANGKVVYIPPRVNHRKCMGDLAYQVEPRKQHMEMTPDKTKGSD